MSTSAKYGGGLPPSPPDPDDKDIDRNPAPVPTSAINADSDMENGNISHALSSLEQEAFPSPTPTIHPALMEITGSHTSKTKTKTSNTTSSKTSHKRNSSVLDMEDEIPKSSKPKVNIIIKNPLISNQPNHNSSTTNTIAPSSNPSLSEALKNRYNRKHQGPYILTVQPRDTNQTSNPNINLHPLTVGH